MYQPKLKALLAFLIISVFIFSACSKGAPETTSNPTNPTTQPATPQKGWQKLGDLDIVVANAFTFEKEGKLYVSAAEVLDATAHPKTYTYSVYELDVAAKKLKKLGSQNGSANMNNANTAAFMVGESIYFYFASTNSLLAFNTLTGNWSARAAIPNNSGEETPSRFAIGGYTHSGKGYVFAGVIHTGLQMDMVQLYEYDPAANAWTSVKLWGTSTEYAAHGFKHDNSFYFMSNLKKLYRYQIGGTTLENLGTTPSNKLALSPFVVVKNNKAYMGTGGEFTLDSNGNLSGDNTSDETWSLDLATYTWTKIDNFGGGKRRGATGYLFNNNIYILGGQSGNTATKQLDAKADLWQYVD